MRFCVGTDSSLNRAASTMGAMKLSVLLLGCGLAGACVAQSATPATDLSASRVFAVADGAVRGTPSGGRGRDILHGALVSGEAVSIHESTQPAGAKPVPLHLIDHSEFVLVREGTVTFVHDGVSETAGPGAILYVAKGTMHAVRTAGETAATYVVIAIGGDVKR